MAKLYGLEITSGLDLKTIKEVAIGVLSWYPEVRNIHGEKMMELINPMHSENTWVKARICDESRIDCFGGSVSVSNIDTAVAEILGVAQKMGPEVDALAAEKHVDRPSWGQYFLKQAMLASERSTCDKIHVGCVLVKNNFVLATGYNGSMPGTPHCNEVGHLVMNEEDGTKGCVRTIHAEINAIGQAAKRGVSTDGAIAYMTYTPCIPCYKALAAAGIVKVYVCGCYDDPETDRFVKEAGGAIPIYSCDVPSNDIWYFPDEWPSAVKHRGLKVPEKTHFRCEKCKEMKSAELVCTKCEIKVCHDCIASRKSFECEDCDHGIHMCKIQKVKH